MSQLRACNLVKGSCNLGYQCIDVLHQEVRGYLVLGHLRCPLMQQLYGFVELHFFWLC